MAPIEGLVPTTVHAQNGHPDSGNAELRSGVAAIGHRSARCRRVRDDAGVNGYLTTQPNAVVDHPKDDT
jgi:hypothetical protein